MRHLAPRKLLCSLWQLKEAKIGLASGEIDIVGVATCRFVTGEADKGKEKDPVSVQQVLTFGLNIT